MIKCAKCESEITSKDDLVVAPVPVKLLTYHVDCYLKVRDRMERLFLGKQPVNDNASTSMAIACMALAIVIFLNSYGYWLIAPLMIIPGVRFFSYLAYEKKLS